MSLGTSLKDVSKILNRLKRKGVIDGYALIGGFAVSVWGIPRGTKDIDFLVSVKSIHELQTFSIALEEAGIKPSLYTGGPSDPVPYLLKAYHKDVPLDMLITTKKWEDEAVAHAVMVDFQGTKIQVIPVEYLILMKLKAGGPKDLLDVEELLKIGNVNIELLESLAKRLRLNKRLEKIRKKKQSF